MSKETEKAFMRFMGRESMKSIHQEREVKIADKKEKELPICGACGKPINGKFVIYCVHNRVNDTYCIVNCIVHSYNV